MLPLNITPVHLGGTPTGERLGERLQAHLRKIDAVAGQSAYREIKPLDLIVITDGCPSVSLSPLESFIINRFGCAPR